MAVRRIGWPALACIAVGCAAFDDSHEDHWRTMTVVAVTRRADLPSDIDSRCADAREVRGDEQVVVLQYRAGRALYRQAFAAPHANEADVGRRILGNPRLCQARTE